jgi:hypothetical protein
MSARLLAAPGDLGELSLQRVDDRAQLFGIDQALLASLKVSHRRLQFGEIFPPHPQHENSLPNICLEVNH